MTQKDKAAYIARYYGYENQSRQAMEEAGELIQAINKHWRETMECGRIRFSDTPIGTAEEVELKRELADNQIMIWQMAYLLGTDLEDEIEQKLNRQIRRISEERGIPQEQRERIMNTFLGGRR